MAQAPAGVMHIAGRYAVIIPAGVVAQSAGRRYAYSRRCAVVVPAGAVVQAPANVRIVRQRFLACNFIS